MYTDMDLYAKVRRAVMVDAMSERAAARNFGISRKTVNKMVNHTVPPGYQRKDRPVAPKLGAFVGIIDQILQDGRDVLKKQRHTAQRIFARLRPQQPARVIGVRGSYLDLNYLAASINSDTHTGLEGLHQVFSPG